MEVTKMQLFDSNKLIRVIIGQRSKLINITVCGLVAAIFLYFLLTLSSQDKIVIVVTTTTTISTTTESTTPTTTETTTTETTTTTTPPPPFDKSNQKLWYVNYVWNEDNKQHRFKFILDDDTLEKSNGKNIFFHITNCIHNGIVDLTARQACAVESAARQNPHLNVFLTFTSQVGFLNTTRLPLIDALLTYPNIYIRNIDLVKYAENTPAEEWVKEGKLYTSVFMMEHVADFLRLVSLYRFGGQYLDLDTVTMKNITLLGSNFCGAESHNVIANAVLNMDKNTEIGRNVANQCLTYFTQHYSATEWAANGPLLVTAVLGKVCGTEDTDLMTREQCGGFKCFGVNEFYALSYYIYPDAFDTDPEKITSIFTVIENSTLAHLSNKLSSDLKIKIDPKKPVAYSKLADLYCPRVFNSLDGFF